MQNPVRVELVPIEVPAEPQTLQHRRDALQRMAKLGMVDNPEACEINPNMTAWVARVNGIEVLVDGYAIEQQDGPQVTVSLVISADSLAIGDPSLATEAPSVRLATPSTPNQRKAAWGDSRPDPRLGIAGWKPEPSLGEQVADNAREAAQ